MTETTEPCILVYVTARDRDEALALGRAAVSAELAACANILDGMQSIYRWQGAVTEEREAVLILKTRAGQEAALTALLRGRHSYDVPCIVALPILGGDAGFLDWIRTQTGQ
jgi:periplasmic divalent cation tolerance protein